jgi:hypothetical protein
MIEQQVLPKLPTNLSLLTMIALKLPMGQNQCLELILKYYIVQ